MALIVDSGCRLAFYNGEKSKNKHDEKASNLHGMLSLLSPQIPSQSEEFCALKWYC